MSEFILSGKVSTRERFNGTSSLRPWYLWRGHTYAVILATCSIPSPVAAGMPSFRLHDAAALRLEVISFFLLGLLMSAAVVWWIWNWLGRDWPWLPRISFAKAFGVVCLWGLLFVIVLSMISGARELMTPGAWERDGYTHKLSDDAPMLSPDERLKVRRGQLDKLYAVLAAYSTTHDGCTANCAGHPKLRGRSQFLPAGAIMDKRGRLTHGWQALILPYMDMYEEVHELIDFEVAWNAPRNEEAYKKEIEPYVNHSTRRNDAPSTDENGYPLSDYSANVHVLGGTTPIPVTSASAERSNTILIGEIVQQRKAWGYSANWRDPTLGINQSPHGFGGPWSNDIAIVVMLDGSVQELNQDIDPKVLRALSDPNRRVEP